MTKKIPDAIFSAVAANGKLTFVNEEHLKWYMSEHDTEELAVHIMPTVKLSQKLKMYAYYHANVLNCAVLGYTAAGWPGIDNVKADYLLRAEFAKDFIKKPNGDYVPIMIDKRNMTKARLLKFIQDCIFFIESDLGIEVPSTDEYRVKKTTGRIFKEVK